MNTATDLQPSTLGSAAQASPTTTPLEHEHDAAELERARAANAQALRDSRESVWYLKEITFNAKRKKIVTQNYNGPCSFIAICNILILRGDIEILPPERTSVSYDILAQLVGEYLLRASPDVDLSAALTMMPYTQKGIDLNPLFTSATAFRPSGDDGGALKLFEQAGIPLVHGWLVDPSSAEHTVLSRIEDYDSSVNLIVEVDTLTKGQFVVNESVAGSSSGYEHEHGNVSDTWSAGDRKKVEDALVVRNFLDSTSSQLTYHGLFTLASSIQPGSLVALFRNSHLSVLHRRPFPKPISLPTADPSPSPPDANANEEVESDPALYNLVTDHVFHNEPSVVWERLEDVDGASSTFVDSEFRRSKPAGGDFAGASAGSGSGSGAGAGTTDPSSFPEFDPADQELARHLQAEEDARAQALYARHGYQQQQQQSQQPQQNQHPTTNPNSNWNNDRRGRGGRPPPTFDPRYAQYTQQQQDQTQQQQQPQYQYQQHQQQQQQQQQNAPPARPAQKMKRKTSCNIM